MIELLHNEEFRSVKNAENLFISNMGRLATMKENEYEIVKPKIGTDLYYQISYKPLKKKSETKYVHRLVAEAFLFNADSKTTIHHINLHKLDNRALNLMYVNTIEHFKIHKTAKPIYHCIPTEGDKEFIKNTYKIKSRVRISIALKLDIKAVYQYISTITLPRAYEEMLIQKETERKLKEKYQQQLIKERKIKEEKITKTKGIKKKKTPIHVIKKNIQILNRKERVQRISIRKEKLPKLPKPIKIKPQIVPIPKITHYKDIKQETFNLIELLKTIS